MEGESPQAVILRDAKDLGISARRDAPDPESGTWVVLPRTPLTSDNPNRTPPHPLKSWIEISAAHLRANFATLGGAAGPDFHLLCVIKADAYGHGAVLCAPVLVEAGAHWLGVGDLEEGIHVRQALSDAGMADRNTHILVMCAFEPEDAPSLVQHHLTPVLWTPAHVEALEAAAATTLGNERFPVHIELDTGMARQGAQPGPELTVLLRALRAARHVRAEGVFSHLSSSEVVGSVETVKQVSRFGATLEQLLEQELMPEYLHLANSSAIEERSTLDWVRDFAANDMAATPLARPGLALYGYTLPLSPADETPGSLAPELHPVATWKTRITGLRDLAPGDTVGYGATFTAPTPMRVALLPIGYADGFRREASSGLGDGWVMVNNQRAPVLGRVSMNLTVVDITAHTPPPTIGDEVILLGPGVTAHDHARWANTIPYEILCGMRGHRRLV